jgi:head-tail adaptor
MGIGAMREPVTVTRNTATAKNAMGERTETFTTLFAGFAEVRPLPGSEAVRRGLTVEMHPVEFRIRYRADKTPLPKDRVVWRSNEHDIVSTPEEDARRRFWMVLGVRVG